MVTARGEPSWPRRPGAEPSLTQDHSPLRTDCPHRGRLTWADYTSRRTVATLAGPTRLSLTVRRCHNPRCPAHPRPPPGSPPPPPPVRPGAGGRPAIALAFGWVHTAAGALGAEGAG